MSTIPCGSTSVLPRFYYYLRNLHLGALYKSQQDDCSNIKNLQRQPFNPSDQGDTIGSHSGTDGHSSKDSKESKKEAQSPISRVIIQKEEPMKVDCRMIPHKRHTPKNMAERVEQLEK